MAAEREPPGSFGIETAVDKLRKHLDQLLGGQHRETHAAWRRIEAAQGRLERAVKAIANGFDNLKQLIDQQGGVIAQEAGQINAKLDENNRLIEELRSQLGNDPRLQALADQIVANNQQIGNFIPDTVPEPGPTP